MGPEASRSDTLCAKIVFPVSLSCWGVCVHAQKCRNVSTSKGWMDSSGRPCGSLLRRMDPCCLEQHPNNGCPVLPGWSLLLPEITPR